MILVFTHLSPTSSSFLSLKKGKVHNLGIWMHELFCFSALDSPLWLQLNHSTCALFLIRREICFSFATINRTLERLWLFFVRSYSHSALFVLWFNSNPEASCYGAWQATCTGISWCWWRIKFIQDTNRARQVSRPILSRASTKQCSCWYPQSQLERTIDNQVHLEAIWDGYTLLTWSVILTTHTLYLYLSKMFGIGRIFCWCLTETLTSAPNFS